MLPSLGKLPLCALDAAGRAQCRQRLATMLASLARRASPQRVLAQPGEVIFPQVNALIAERGWKVKELNVERGRLDEVFRTLTRGEQP